MKEEFRHSVSTHAQIDDIKSKGIASWRSSRGDGNCYYRAVANAYLEYCIRTGILTEFYLKIHNGENFFAFANQHPNQQLTANFLTDLYKLCNRQDPNRIEQMRDM